MVTAETPRATFHSPPEVGHTHTQIHVNIPPVCAHFVDDTRTDAPSRSGMIRRNFGPKTGVSGDLTRARRAHPPSSPPSVAARHALPASNFIFATSHGDALSDPIGGNHQESATV